MIDYIKDHGGMFGLLGLIIAIFALVLPMRRERITDTAQQLCDPHFREKIQQGQRLSRGGAYFAALTWLTTKANGFYGDRLIGWRAFERCLLIAFLYPVFAAVLAWAAFNVHSPGDFTLFQDEPDRLTRLWKATFLALSLGLLGYILAKIEVMQAWIYGKLIIFLSRLTNPTGFHLKAVGFVSFLILLAGVVVLLGVVFLLVGGVVFLLVAGVGVGVGVAGGAGVVGGVVLILVVSVGVGVVLGETETASTFAFFYLFLPFLNAGADFVSVAMTRKFLGWANTKRPGFLSILLAAVLDAIWGLLCLFALLWALTSCLDLWQSIAPQTVPFDWRAYWAEVSADPSQGAALWLMALTTLLPTLIHLCVGLTGMLTHGSRRRAEAIEELTAVCGTAAFTEARQMTIAKKLVAADSYLAAMAFVMAVVAVYGIWQAYLWIAPHLTNWHLWFPS